jgi:hypothetical protein
MLLLIISVVPFNVNSPHRHRLIEVWVINRRVLKKSVIDCEIEYFSTISHLIDLSTSNEIPSSNF